MKALNINPRKCQRQNAGLGAAQCLLVDRRIYTDSTEAIDKISRKNLSGATRLVIKPQREAYT